MPDSSFDLKTEVDYYTNVLIVDELGEISTVLINSLLSHGCLISYYGREKKEAFHYLQEKNNFLYLDSFSEVEPLKKIDYFFYLAAENDPKLLKEDDLLWLTEKFRCRTLIVSPFAYAAVERYSAMVKERWLNLRLVVFDCLFGPRIKSGILAKLFRAGIGGNQISLAESSEKKLFPLSAAALSQEIIRLIFAADTKSKVYFLQGEEITLGDFASLVKKYCPNLGISFLGKEPERQITTGEWENLKVQEALEERIEETADWFERNLPEESVPAEVPIFETEIGPKTTEKKKEPQRPKAALSRKIIFGVSLFLLLTGLFFVLPLILTGALGVLGVKELEKTKVALNQGNLSLAIKRNDSCLKILNLSQKVVLTTSPFYALIGLGKKMEAVSETLLFSQNISESIKFSLLAGQDLMKWSGEFMNGGGGNKEEVLGSVKANLASAYGEASLAQLSLAKAEAGFKLFRETGQFEKVRKDLPQLREGLLKVQNLLTVLPKLLGFSGRKTYLLLFQNNAELRPTGGFIGSFGLLNLENGKLIDLEVFDVYQADGQLKGHVEPPAKLKEYLGEAGWYLRDSNWDPDFTISAQRAQWFLDKEMQASVDGTIAVTLEAVRQLVAAMGEVIVPEYQEKINQENLFQKAEYYAELGTFPGSTQKKDFLGSLSQALFEKMKNAKDQELVNLGGAFFNSLEQKEIMLYFNDPEVESVANNLNWGGRIRSYQPASSGQPILADFLFINEANVGINKANFFVQRKIDHLISLNREGKIEEKLTLTYDNQSPSESWPAGRYKSYLRLYLPLGTKVTSVLMTDPKNPGLWLPFDWHFFDSSEEHGKSLFGFLFEIPYKTKSKIEIKYELDRPVDLSKKLTSYLLLLQKQSGAYPSSYTLSFLYPENLVPVRVIPSAVVGDKQLLVTAKLDRDLIFQVDLAH